MVEQTYPNIEYIIADDCSANITQKDIQLISDYVNKSHIKTYKFIKQKENLGTVKNLNSALRIATGDYVFLLSADDIFHNKNVLKDWVGVFQKTGANVITAYRELYDGDMKDVIGVTPNLRQAKRIKTFSPNQLYQDLCRVNYVFGCVTARTMKSLQKYGFFDERYRVLEDYPMNLYLLRMGEPLYFWDNIVVKSRNTGISNPKRFNDIYEKDSDLLYHLELSRYAEDKEKIKKSYSIWKIKHKRTGAYLLAKESPLRFSNYFRLLTKYPILLLKDLLSSLLIRRLKSIYRHLKKTRKSS